MAQIIDGKALAAQIREGLKQEIAQLKQKGAVPGLGVVLVGQDPASRVYVNMKEKACEQVGIHSVERLLPQEATQEEVLQAVRAYNEDPSIHGILVQLPLPKQVDTRAVLEAIDPAKDVDGFHPMSLGQLLADRPGFVPCTPAGILKLIETTNVPLKGARAVVVGRSLIVGKPVALLLLAQHATVTLCHSRTRDLARVCREADILVAAVGRPKLITAEMVKPGAVVIDVGVNRLEDGKLVGDVDFDAVRQVAGYLTPVPGGVGPMTVTMLLVNTVRALKAHLALARTE